MNNDPLSYQFQNLQFNNNNNNNNNTTVPHPLLGDRVPLSRTSSLVDSIGMQRASSPYANGSTAEHHDALNQRPPLTTARSQSALLNSWQPSSSSSTSQNHHHNDPSTPNALHPSLPLNHNNSTTVMPSVNQTSVFNHQIPLHTSSTSSLLQMHPPGANPALNPLPPGIPASFMPFPQPIISHWKYKDMQGNIQGPFDSSTMAKWYESNYFQPDLSICRMGSTYEPLGINDRFITLTDLARLVQNVKDPFSAFDQMVSIFQQQQQQQQRLPPQMHMTNHQFNPPVTTETITNVTNTLPRVSNFFPADSQTKKEEPQQENNLDDLTLEQKINRQREHLVAEADIEASGDYTQDEIFKMKFDDGSYYREVTVPVSMNRKHIRKMDVSTIIKENDLGDYWAIKETPEYVEKMQIFAKEDEIKNRENQEKFELERKENERQEVIKKEQLKKEAELNARENARLNEEKRRKEKAEKAAKLLLEEQERNERESRKREELKLQKKQKKLKEQQEKVVHKEKKKMNQKQKLEALKAEKANQLLGMSEAEDEVETEDETNFKQNSAANSEAIPSAPIVTAPWANKTVNVSSIPKINLKEQAIHAQKKLEEKESRERQRAMKLNTQILLQDKEEESRKAMLNWASMPKKSQQIPVSIDIKSQLMNNTPKKNNSTKITSKKEPLEDPSFIEEQKKIWEQVQRNNTKHKTTTSDDGAWSTVTKKTNTIDKKNATLKPVGQSISVPSLKKPAVAISTNHYPGNASISARQEFLRWCKSQLKLNPGISMNSVLEVLLSLPAGPIANEIIADTIYSNSSVMDGRRFATEFTKKRVQCEKQVKDPLSWSEALALPEGNDDDWEFQVVSKKKGKRH
ncbi:similar to Saccharomyces cerevisiae YBR172C SMY2 Protein of unknown function involved in COPII vesicle formation [Maudiozyma barnettii]|uniref:GYF domain-containing protein n=1 Tax=Maudiozyma barnettii TaxID=61262 RepID=A0A8H2VDS2_9SACH|nr:Smy2p [Kazachstania barnettii]CAB4253662.1 similar to Saccharomyces cerevisiae YBR172C SMY2 Protein of unknown function involved in COPII vesicle formation [Kazachstania barnettii]CAD1781358.1 similar to Saccharomyces cerevisiae YBR172C SMY2 Protein of unknown function involved in COPII vesicle formation [Kazachstania barnettii]